jgi:hypothetical protein
MGKSESDREVLLGDILDVRDDIQTDVMLRAYQNKAYKGTLISTNSCKFNVKIIIFPSLV